MRAVGAVFRSRSGVIFRAGSSKSPLVGTADQIMDRRTITAVFSLLGGPATGVTYANWTGARAPGGWSFVCPKGPCPTDVTASARSHRQVISSARPTEFPCRLWNALGRAKSMKTGILRLATKNSPTDRDDDRRGSRSDVADRYQLFPVSNRRRNSSIFGDLRAF